MNIPRLLIIPSILKEGKEYLMLEKIPYETRWQHSTVKFTSYTACPAVVVVQTGDGARRRCPRECLAEVQALGHYVQGRKKQVEV